MKKTFNVLKCASLACILLASPLYAQIADDGFTVPLDVDFTNAKETVSAAAPASGDSGLSIKMGLWIETVSHNNSIIRDLATGEKSGYEFDNSLLYSYANWWFWGDLNKNFHLDAEIAAWDFTKTIYHANTFGSNVPDVTWADGLQSLLELPFSFMNNGNDNGIGAFNKMGFTILTPVLNAKIGYGNLKDNGMAEFTGIYTTLDRWLDVGKGFTEFSNGSAWQSFGSIKLNVLAAFSQMKGTYGSYGFATLDWNDKLRAVLTYGSMTTEEQLFFYNKTNTNSASAYIKFNATDFMSFEAHALDSFGTEIEDSAKAYAVAGRVNLNFSKVKMNVSESFAQKYADSVWGADGTECDNICKDSSLTKFNIEVLPKDYLSFSLNEKLKMENVENLAEGKMILRNQLNFDLDFDSLLGKDMKLAAYGVFNLDRLSKETSGDQELIPYFSEAGLEYSSSAFSFAKKLTVDYAVKSEYKDWESGSKYDLDVMYHSIMVNADFTDKLNVHLGAVIRTKDEEDKKLVPFGIAAGFSLAKLPILDSPKLYAHATYGMNPYTDDDYSLYRLDHKQNKREYRTFLLNDLENDATSQISVGIIWQL